MKLNPDLIREYAYPVGTTIITKTNINPSATLGGTGTLTKKEFINYPSTSVFSTAFTRSKATTNSNIGVSRSGNGMTIESIMYSSDAMSSDTNIDLGTLDTTKIGLTMLPHYLDFTAGSETANGVVMIYITNNTDNISHGYLCDYIMRNRSNPFPANSSIFINISGPAIHPDYMIDSFCDKFFGKRTA